MQPGICQEGATGSPELTGTALTAWHKDPLSLSKVIEVANRAISDGCYDIALRYADRAWRMSPDSPLVCQILVSLLLNREDADQALRVLERLGPQHHVDLAALHIDALRCSGRLEDARIELGRYLGMFAADPEGSLVKAASALVAERAGWGWIGVTPELRLTGHIGPPHHGDTTVLSIRKPGGGEENITIPAGDAAGTREHLAVIPATDGMLVQAADAGIILIGDRIVIPPDFGLWGSATVGRASVSGTIGLAWNPLATPPRLFLERKDGRKPVPMKPDETTPGIWQFEIPVGRLDRLAQARLNLTVALPDGRVTSFPGSPFGLASVRPYRTRRPTRRPEFHSAGTAIVIPIYRGEDETRACIESVLATVPTGVPVIVVNDGSPETGITALVHEYRRHPRITVIENNANLGFPASANRGMRAAPEHDIVLLNSDTVVFPGWFERLCAHAASNPGIATVTPLSNSGSIASYPGGHEHTCDKEIAQFRNAMAARINEGQSVAAPTGVGFCMFVRRACLDQVGAFDENLFGRGYGEENDFCLRASAHGWTHVIAGDVYVLHRNGVSFGSARNGWMARNEAVLTQRHPTYKASVETFHEAQPLAPLRRCLDEAILREGSRPIALLVSLALPGGVQKHVDARIEALEQQGYLPVLLRPTTETGYASLTVAHREEFQDLRYRLADEIDALRDLLDHLPIAQVEIHHFLGMDTSFVDACFAVEAPVDIYIHDYSWYCPRLSLLGTDGLYCGEPDAAGCRNCIKQAGSELHDGLDPDSLRDRSGHWLAQARTIFVPCQDVASRYARIFPDRSFRVTPWEPPTAPALPTTGRVPHRIAVLGAVGEQKGRAVLLACARHAALHNLPLEFVLIGFSDDEESLLRTGKLFITGRYDEAELPLLLQREAPSAIFLPSVTPETWSYSLSHAMATGLPIVAFDIGAIAERLRQTPHPHHLIPLETTGAQINEMLIALPSAIDASLTEVSLSAHSPGDATVRNPDNGLTSTAEFLTLARGLYHFSVVPTGSNGAGQAASLPALQIVAAPGERKSDIEYVSSPGAEHQWLRSSQDSVILKVNGDAVKVVVVLLTTPGLAPLQIDVRKLDGEQGAYAFADAPAQQQAIHVAGQPPVARPGATLLRAQIVAHAEFVGDVIGIDQAWVGAPDTERAIECLSITPITNIAPASIEYKTLGAAGEETQWVDQGRPCGTRGMAKALHGFAIRQKPQATTRFLCEYSGKFASGRIVGPLTDGAMCVSPLAGDRLVGVWLHIVDSARQQMDAMPPPHGEAHSADTRWQSPPPVPVPAGPKFSVFREISA